MSDHATVANYCKRQVETFVALARKHGHIITVHNAPLWPLAAGNTAPVVEMSQARWLRESPSSDTTVTKEPK